MSFAAGAIASIAGGVYSAKRAEKGQKAAANAQIQAAQLGIDEQRRQFDAMMALMQPYVQGGTQAMGAQGNLIGLGGAEAQQAAINELANSPQMAALIGQGENALLQNASATGGLRGGNTQAALAQFRPQLLNELINQRFTQLGSLSQLGQASAAGQAAQGMNMATNIGNLLEQQGAARAGSALASGNMASNAIGNALNIGSTLLNMGGYGKKFF